MIIENQDFVENNNNNNKTTGNTKQPLSDKESFGTQLKSARVANQTSIDEIANSLNLETKIIQAIEEMDIKNLPSTAFVCGYIRSYAQILKLDADQLVQDYLKATVPIEKLLKPKNKNTSMSVKIKPIYLFAFITIIVVVVIWYIKNEEERLQKENIEQAQKINKNTTNNNNVNNAVNDKISDKVAPITRASIEPENEEQTADIADIPATITSSQIPVPDYQKTDVELKPNTEKIINDKLLPNILPPKLTINISTTDQSWVEIQDRSQKQLYYKLLNKNEQINIEGFYPFYLSIGNASTVSVKVNDVNFDFKEYIRLSNTAKFSINNKNLKKIQEQKHE